MNITCPQCQFTRTVPDDRLPGPTAIATCPQCGRRFRVFRDDDAPAHDAAAPSAPASAPATPPATAPGAFAPDNAERHNAAPDNAAPGAFAPDNAERNNAAPDNAAPGADKPTDEQDDPLPPGAIIPGQYPPPTAAARTGQPASSGPGATDKKSAPANSAPNAASAPSAKGDAPRPVSPEAEDDPEYRQAAVQAYQRQSQRDEAGDDMQENPWLHPEREGYLAAFYQTTMRVMFAAPRFFAGLRPDTPQLRALSFYLLVSICQILVERIWGDVLSSALTPGATGDPQLQKLIQMLTPQTNILMALLLRTAIVTMELFIASALYFLIFRLLVPKKANYQLIFQVLAYSAAPALLCVVPVAGSVVGFIWGVACSFVGCRHALGLTWTQTVMGLVPVYALGVPFILHLLQSAQALTG